MLQEHAPRSCLKFVIVAVEVVSIAIGDEYGQHNGTKRVRVINIGNNKGNERIVIILNLNMSVYVFKFEYY